MAIDKQATNCHVPPNTRGQVFFMDVIGKSHCKSYVLLNKLKSRRQYYLIYESVAIRKMFTTIHSKASVSPSLQVPDGMATILTAHSIRLITYLLSGSIMIKLKIPGEVYLSTVYHNKIQILLIIYKLLTRCRANHFDALMMLNNYTIGIFTLLYIF